MDIPGKMGPLIHYYPRVLLNYPQQVPTFKAHHVQVFITVGNVLLDRQCEDLHSILHLEHSLATFVWILWPQEYNHSDREKVRKRLDQSSRRPCEETH